MQFVIYFAKTKEKFIGFFVGRNDIYLGECLEPEIQQNYNLGLLKIRKLDHFEKSKSEQNVNLRAHATE